MKKQLNILILTLLILSQTILGPAGTVWASEDDGSFMDGIVEDNLADGPSDDLSSEARDENSTEGDEGTASSDGQGNGDSGDLASDGEDENISEGEKDSDLSDEDGDPAQGEKDVSECEDGVEGSVFEDEESDSDCKKDDEKGDLSETPSGPFDPVMPVEVIRGVEFTVNGETVGTNGSINVKNGDKASFKFNVLYNAGVDGGNYGEGTTLTYELPEIFEGLELPGGTAFGSIGTLSVQGRSVVITFNEELNGNAPIEGADGELYAYFEVEASFSETNVDWEKTIHLPGDHNITLNFQPKGGDTVTKIGTPDNGGQNSKFIDWTVTVNTNLGATGVQNFIDELEGEHTFVTDLSKIIVKEIPITPNGPGAPGKIVTVVPNFENGNKKMTISLPDDRHTGYEITYQTEVGDPGNVPSAEFKNKATYNDQSISKNPQVTFGDPLAKSHSGPGTDLITTWTIKYNFNNRNIAQENAKLEDTWIVTGGSGTGKQELLSGSFKVYEENGTTEVDASQYTMTPKETGAGFDLSFNHPVTKPYVITYQTKPDGVYRKPEL